MGSTFSTGNNVYVYADKAYYHGGDLVNGYVLLNCVNAFECSQVLLKLNAYEKVYWEERQEHHEYRDGKTHTRTDYHTHSARHDFFHITHVLYSWPQYCQPGQYQFPFSFVLPMALPGTFEHMDSGHQYRNTKASVKYKLTAECVVPGTFKRNIRHKGYLTVYQPFTKPPSEIQAAHHQEVTKCCCCKQGQATITCNVQKDSYMPGETACVILQVDNKSEAEFSAIHLKLQRCVELHASGTQRRDETLATSTFPGVAAHTTRVGPDAIQLQLTLPHQMLLPTTIGQIIQCKYKLVVTLKAAAFVSNVELKVPVMVYIPAPQHIAYAQPPEWWHATMVATPTQLSLPSAPPAPPGPQQMDRNKSQAPDPALLPYGVVAQTEAAGGMLPTYPQAGSGTSLLPPLPQAGSSAPGVPQYPQGGAAGSGVVAAYPQPGLGSMMPSHYAPQPSPYAQHPQQPSAYPLKQV